ncbi:MAG: hypothetical protein ACO3BD_07145 [Chitinophagaceae bacterium]
MTTTLKAIPGEKWITISEHRAANGDRYAISNHGRLVKFTKEVKDGSLLKGSLQEGYPIWRFHKRKKNGDLQHDAILLHRLVANYFLPSPKKGQTVIIHHNHKKTDNYYKNLKWATTEEATAHAQNSPRVKKARKELLNRFITEGKKLQVKDVVKIKQMLKQNKTLKQIAAHYGVSDMQIHRIKTGENWKHVKA